MPELKSYFIKTFGCQMNEVDSEKIAEVLKQQGQIITNDIGEADVVVINTCSVRESAENRVFGLVNNLTQKLAVAENYTKSKKKIILTGCMLYHGLSWLRKKLPQVDEFKTIKELMPSSTIHHSPSILVPIMGGCNNFCSYCVVPYARGREKSRPFEEIVCTVKELTRRGVKAISLLGQNVNSYGKDFSKEEIERLQDIYHILIYDIQSPFALLLRVLHNLPGSKKISFLTSNPWDLTDDIIEAMKLSKIDRYLHLPVQSGSDEVLRRMNRRYTAQDYFALVKKIRLAIPAIKIGTDIIVGFPGETKAEFQRTVDLCKKIGFAKAYIARYSPRPGTAAYRLKDSVPPREKKRRWEILEKLINKQSFSANKLAEARFSANKSSD